jgi:hypothetical protein
MKRERELRVVQDRERWDQKVRNASDHMMPRGKRMTKDGPSYTQKI